MGQKVPTMPPVEHFSRIEFKICVEERVILVRVPVRTAQFAG